MKKPLFTIWIVMFFISFYFARSKPARSPKKQTLRYSDAIFRMFNNWQLFLIGVGTYISCHLNRTLEWNWNCGKTPAIGSKIQAREYTREYNFVL